MTYTETIEHSTETCGGKTYPVIITRRRGVHQFVTPSGEELLVNAVTINDAGRRGVSCCYTVHQEFTAEERAAGRKHIQDTLRRIMDEQGLW